MNEKNGADCRQAYLIIAHKDDLSFRTLIQMLDDERNDIFIHMDSKNKKYCASDVERMVHYSTIFHTKRTSITWGGYSQVYAELLLIKAATEVGRYQHYHLISGDDLPIKTQDEIVRFFCEHDGKEFVRFENEVFQYGSRVRYYHFFQERVGRSRNIFLRGGNWLSLKAQKMIRVNRNTSIDFQKGTNWFSITDDLARYVVSKEDWIDRTFKITFCSDEIFLQTLVVNSKFREHLFHCEFDNNPEAIMRLIDWTRGRPYTFKASDFDELETSRMLFARKFDERVDAEIIRMVQSMGTKSESEAF